MRVQVGQIYEVITDTFLTSKKNEVKRQVKIECGEKIEIRYPSEWHFRTFDDKYFHCEEKELLSNCKLIGVIIEVVRFKNIAKLKDILNLELYEKVTTKQSKD